jgi:hypothetical protein
MRLGNAGRADMRRHRNAAVLSDFGSTKTLSAFARVDISRLGPGENELNRLARGRTLGQAHASLEERTCLVTRWFAQSVYLAGSTHQSSLNFCGPSHG